MRLGQSAGIDEVLYAAIDAAVFGAEREREGVGEVPIGREFGGVDVVVGQQLRVGQSRIPGHKLAHGLELFVSRGDIVGVDRRRKSDELARDRVEIRKAGGGTATIFTVGNDLPEPTTVIDIPKKR